MANGKRRCSPSELSSARGTPAPTLRHTPRQCRAHRTGCEPVPLERVASMLRIAGCRQPAIRVGARRPCGGGPFLAQPASGHHDAAQSAGRGRAPCPGARRRATRMPQGGNVFPWWRGKARSDACASPANAENRKPPAGTEGVRVPRKIGVADLPWSQPGVSTPVPGRTGSRLRRGHPRAAPRRSAWAAVHGRRRWRRPVSSEQSWRKKRRVCRRARTIRRMKRMRKHPRA